MILNTINFHQSTPFIKGVNPKGKFTVEHEFFTSKSEEKLKSSTAINMNSSTIYEDLSGKYEVRNATFEEISKISKILYESGAISFKEHMTLIFDFERATNYLKQNVPFPISAHYDMHETLSTSDGKRDWISEFEARASKNFKMGNIIGYESNKRIFTILQKLDKQ